MYPRIAVVTLLQGEKLIFGTYEEYISREEAAETIRQKWAVLTGERQISADDISIVVVIPNDGYPYRV